MKTLFDPETAEWTDKGRAASTDFLVAIDELFKRLVAEGYSPREVAYIANSAVSELELKTLLYKRFGKENKV